MKTAVFSAKPYDKEHLEPANQSRHELVYFEAHLNPQTAVLAKGFDAVCCFVNDTLDAETIATLGSVGVRMIAMRCAGFNNVDLDAARQAGIRVARVPEYSPYAVAEHAVALILDLNRNIHRAYNRVRENDYSLSGLLGFDLHGKTVGVIGTGKIGVAFARIMAGFGCRVLASDPFENPALQGVAEYVELDCLFREADIISLHCPLLPQTHHLINAETISQMKRGVMIINTSRGGLIDTPAVIDGLKSEQVGYLGLDVYEEEAELFFEDYSNVLLQDDVFARLLTFPNVVITGHQAFFTQEALSAIAEVTVKNLNAFEKGDTQSGEWVA
ncbi:hydroxyacid dehydrogenase [Hahella sp. CCB-MM4]|uniref:2-hydroxyacid dehydrogenase n=1 Tax=Hahella sp. (strain CCB-MM4) TaxID=1926491 RepID=UPI000B9B7D15|nr:2-hydroxyacid dehydrogenase [Hahella sp. CCB-MM4]OZG75418.1 hydroxyacid dehydrogenase [Hahella sp. CCB-MM4]